MMNRSEHIQSLLDRFFAGDTSCAEENELQRYFRDTADLPQQWLPYRDMFAWFDSGMNPEQLPKPIPRKKAMQGRRLWVWCASTAAAITLVVSLATRLSRQDLNPTDIYAGSYIVHNGVAVIGSSEIESEVEAALEMGAALDREIDMQMASLNHNDSPAQF